jgi:hypothetical protein
MSCSGNLAGGLGEGGEPAAEAGVAKGPSIGQAWTLQTQQLAQRFRRGIRD